MNSTSIGVFALVISILCTSVINFVEIAVVSANRLRVHHLAEEGSRPAQALERLQHDRESFFAAIVFIQTFLVVFAGALGGEIANGISDSFLVVIGATVITALVTAQFGDIIPKVLASKVSDSFTMAVALPTELLIRVLGPVAKANAFLPRLLSKAIFGVSANDSPAVTEAELRMLIDISAESGSVAEEEAELLDRVFHFGDRAVHEVMIPRTEAVWLPQDASLRDFYAVYGQAPHSRFPVFAGDTDHVCGILGIKDVLHALGAGEIREDGSIEPLIRPAFFVPETKAIGELFREMQEKGVQMAVAVDEFGGTAGIVTLESLLEEMVGPMGDELRPADAGFQEIDEHTHDVDGSLSIADARDELDIDLPEGPYDTIAGFVLEQLGHIPVEGEQVPVDGHSITVAEMRGQKIETLRITKP